MGTINFNFDQSRKHRKSVFCSFFAILPQYISKHFKTLEKYRKNLPASCVFYISLVFSNAHGVFLQCNTPLRLLYLVFFSYCITQKVVTTQCVTVRMSYIDTLFAAF